VSQVSEHTPERIGKYEITGVAGRGAMGVVYIGYDPIVDRKVAIKVAYPAEDDDNQARVAKKMFLNEAQTAGSLDHPNILKVYDAGEFDGALCMVMEYIEGADTLKSFCEPKRLLPIDTVVTYMRQCAEALEYAHRHGIVHRDIKPANLMLNKEGKIKIGDFGIARRTQTDQTQVLGWFGSPMYMSPEQARDEELTGQSDLFSMGSVFYQLLSGRATFGGRGISGLINKVLNEDPTPLRELRPEIPEQLAAIVHRCLEKSRERRYHSGAEIVADLNNLLSGLEAEPSQADKLKTLKTLRFFEGFSDGMIQEVMKVAKWESFPADHVLIKEGSQDGGFYVIVNGQLSVSRDEKAIGSIDPGECAGEIAYLTGQRRSATVKTLTKVATLHIATKLSDWASVPLQMRVNKAFQRALIDRVLRANDRLVRRSL
jgi:serine/threonine protein kinase